MRTDKSSLFKNPQPICRSLLIHKGLEAAGPRENTLDIENTQMFLFLFRGRRKENPPRSACCGEASPRRRRQAQTSRGWNNTSTWTVAARLHDKWTGQRGSGWEGEGVGGVEERIVFGWWLLRCGEGACLVSRSWGLAFGFEADQTGEETTNTRPRMTGGRSFIDAN